MKTLTIRMKADDVAEVLLYDVIGGDFFSDGIDAKTFRAAVKSVKAKTINLRINSPGGSVTEGAAMLTALDEFPGRIEVDVDGLAASAASVVAMAGDHIRVASNGLVMIHDPYAMTAGNADDMRRMADLLDKVKGQITDAYARHSKAGRDQIAAWMAAETWFTGQEAVEAGLAHEAAAPVQVAALAGHRRLLSRLKYRHVPRALSSRAGDAGANPMTFAVGDSVQWLAEDPAEMCAELEDGVIEEVSEGTLAIPGTSLSLKGSADDPAVRVIDEDEDETCWYLVRSSQLRRAGEGEEPAGTNGTFGNQDEAWEETRRRAAIAASL